MLFDVSCCIHDFLSPSPTPSPSPSPCPSFNQFEFEALSMEEVCRFYSAKLYRTLFQLICKSRYLPCICIYSQYLHVCVCVCVCVWSKGWAVWHWPKLKPCGCNHFRLVNMGSTWLWPTLSALWMWLHVNGWTVRGYITLIDAWCGQKVGQIEWHTVTWHQCTSL